jgi:hypothetical protein
MPLRVQLRRAKGWRMPPNTVKVDRTTEYGNPFIVGEHGTREYCIELYELLALGLLCVSVERACVDRQRAAVEAMAKAQRELKGKNLACWCPPGAACHADVLLLIANRKTWAKTLAAKHKGRVHRIG